MKITINQIILLLEVYRGTEALQSMIGTNNEDYKKLVNLKLIKGKEKGGITTWKTTKQGTALVTNIKYLGLMVINM